MKHSRKLSLILFGGIGTFTFFKYRDVAKDLFIPTIHPTKEYAEMLIKLDKRITNFCGYNYKISGFKIIENSEKYQSYRMNLSGIRGECKVLVKVQKLDQEELKFINEQQKKISMMPYEERKKEPFVPVDFKDILVPTEETINKIQERLGEVKAKFQSQSYIQLTNEKGDHYNRNDFKITLFTNTLNNTNTNNSENIQNKIDNMINDPEFKNAININENDTFYRFMNISVSYSEDVIFNIRPLTIKFRDYELIETKYTDENYFDVFKKINKIKNDYNKKINYELSAEEARDEIRITRQNSNGEKIERRSKFFKFQVVTLIALLFGTRHYLNTVKYKNIYDGVSKNLKKNKILKKHLGEEILIPYLSFRYNLFSKNFTFRCIAQIGDKKIIVKGKSLPNADNILPKLEFYNMENKLIQV